MSGLDERLVELGETGGLWLALVVALLIGVRHATDPDHLTALSTLVLGEGERGSRRAARLGLAWGSGHAVTLVVAGLPVVLFNDALPGWAQRGAELLVAVVIVSLAVRLLLRCRRGSFHAHPHEHEPGVVHAHPHVHERGGHAHAHAASLGRTARAAFGIGLVHGAGGSAGVGILVIAAIDADAEAIAALLLFAIGTAVSMAACSAAWGRLLAGAAVERRLSFLAPAFGAASLTFGCWYGLGALA